MALLPQTKKWGRVTYNLKEMVSTTKQRVKRKKILSKTMSVRTLKGTNSAGKTKYGLYTAWKK